MRSPGGPLGSGFRALFFGSLISNTGDGIRLAALPLLAAELTSSPVVVSAVTAAQYLPWVSVAPLGGALVDRHDRRRMILVTQSWRGAVMLVLAWLVASDLVAIWHLCVVAFVITAGEILVDPSVVALVPTLVNDEQLDTANGRISSVEIVTNDFAGGPAGATAFGIAPWLPFLLDAGSYLASLVPFRRLPSDPPVPDDQPHDEVRPAGRPTLLSDAAEGIRFLRRHPILGPVTAATMVYYLGAATGFSLSSSSSSTPQAVLHGRSVPCSPAAPLAHSLGRSSVAGSRDDSARERCWRPQRFWRESRLLPWRCRRRSLFSLCTGSSAGCRPVLESLWPDLYSSALPPIVSWGESMSRLGCSLAASSSRARSPAAPSPPQSVSVRRSSSEVPSRSSRRS